MIENQEETEELDDVMSRLPKVAKDLEWFGKPMVEETEPDSRAADAEYYGDEGLGPPTLEQHYTLLGVCRATRLELDDLIWLALGGRCVSYSTLRRSEADTVLEHGIRLAEFIRNGFK